VIRDLPIAVELACSQWTLTGIPQVENVVAIAGIDTRKLTRILRDRGAQDGCIMAGKVNETSALKAAREFPGLVGMDLAKGSSAAGRRTVGMRGHGSSAGLCALQWMPASGWWHTISESNAISCASSRTGAAT
jgi:carbamoylphosphate synthase small subunit